MSKPRLTAKGLADWARLVNWLTTTSGLAACTARATVVGVEGVADRRDDAGHTQGGDPPLAAGEHGDVVPGRDEGLHQGTPDGPGASRHEDAHEPRLRVPAPSRRLWQDEGVSEHSGYPGAPPGWYPDPAGGPGQRWWDGYAWTEATVLPERPPPPPWAGAAPPQGPPAQVAPWAMASERLNTFNTSRLVDDELRMVPMARVAVVMPAVYYLVSLILQRVNADQLRAVGHQFRVDWHDAQNGITPPPYHGPSGFSPVNARRRPAHCRGGDRGLHLAAPGRVGRAGTRDPIPPLPRLGRRFVVRAGRQPVGALLAPSATASRPTTRTGRGVLQWWIAWLAAAFLSQRPEVCALFSTGAALVLSIPAALACLAVIAWAPGIVTAIAAAHREALARATRDSGALRA